LSGPGERCRSAHHWPSRRRPARSIYAPRARDLSGRPLRQHADRQYARRMDRCTGFVLHCGGEC
jgi:hypothetical protein